MRRMIWLQTARWRNYFSQLLNVHGDSDVRQTETHTLREECRLRVFEKRVLRRIFGPKRDEVTGE
jgi:hypothetical protein